ncbi:MAG: hypothetical protein ACLUN6_03810 [Holdemanella sp.]|uniref:hypothetical protein n=1 Tax=Holdemanella sp. TaxID=1971762 RepID=UPI003990EE5A
MATRRHLVLSVDTLGLMVREIKANGRLGFALLGGPSCQAVETENVTVVTRDGRSVYRRGGNAETPPFT